MASAWSATGLVAWFDHANPFFNDAPLIAVIPAFAAAALRTRRVAAGALGLCAVAWLVTARTPTGPAPARLVLFGVDGATFDVIDQLELPEFERLERDGARGTLTSIEPMFSPILWSTIASGRSPDEHGVEGFHVQSTDCRVARFWDIAEDAGLSIGLYKWLADYPPREVGGFWVPGWLAPSPEAWPPELSVVKEVELANRLRRTRRDTARPMWRVGADLTTVGVRLTTIVDAISWELEGRLLHPSGERRTVRLQMIRGRIDRDVLIAQLYARRPDVVAAIYVATDGLAHLYWEGWEGAGSGLAQAYQQADEEIGELRRHLGPDATLIVVSDHGFRAMDGKGQAGQFAPLTERLRARIGDGVGPVDVSRLGHKLVVAAPDLAERARVAAWLEALKDAQGQQFYALADVPDNARAIGLTLADETITPERLRNDLVGGEPIARYVELTDAYTGTHDERGVYYTVGPGVAPGSSLADQSVYDVAPTVLAALGLPASEEMRGRSIVFPERPRVPSWDHLVPGLRWLSGQAGTNEDALKALGYIQ